jgi:hypothetical protein
VLQWATFRDASDQTSLSRIWGGIHVPADDIVGRKLGRTIGINAFEFAKNYFNGTILSATEGLNTNFSIYPNPTKNYCTIELLDSSLEIKSIALFDMQGLCIKTISLDSIQQRKFSFETSNVESGLYHVVITTPSRLLTSRIAVIH